MDIFENLLSKKETQKVNGIMAGTILENYNKDFLGMVKVAYAFGEKGKNTSGWIPVCMPYTGQEFGMYFLPEVGTEVIINFIMGNIDKPVVIGSLWNKKIKMPKTAPNEKNTIKMIETKCGHKIVFKEEEKKEGIEIITKTGLKIILLDEKSQITISDKDGKNTILLDGKSGGISLDAEKKIELKVGGTPVITLDKSKAEITTNNITIKGKQGLKMEGQSLNLKGSTIEIKAQGSLKINSSGIGEIKASLLKLN